MASFFELYISNEFSRAIQERFWKDFSSQMPPKLAAQFSQNRLVRGLGAKMAPQSPPRASKSPPRRLWGQILVDFGPDLDDFWSILDPNFDDFWLIFDPNLVDVSFIDGLID